MNKFEETVRGDTALSDPEQDKLFTKIAKEVEEQEEKSRKAYLESVKRLPFRQSGSARVGGASAAGSEGV